MRVCEHEWRERDGRVGDVFEARIGRKKTGRGEYGSKVETIGRNSIYILLATTVVLHTSRTHLKIIEIRQA